MSDNGKQFDNPKFRDFCAELGIKNYYSSPTHPQSNGHAEVTIRTLKAALETKLEDLKGKWVEYLLKVLRAYRTTRKSVTQVKSSCEIADRLVLPLEDGLQRADVSLLSN